MNGTVKFFNVTKGFGFIKSENGDDVFVHITWLVNQQAGLTENQEVTFDLEEGKKGPMAVNVTVIGEWSMAA